VSGGVAKMQRRGTKAYPDRLRLGLEGRNKDDSRGRTDP